MRPRIIESLDKWYIFKQALIDNRYKLWQMQYNWDMTTGFHAWFFKNDKNVEVVTHCKEVQEDIIGSGMT